MPADPKHEDLLKQIMDNFKTGDAGAIAALYEADAVYHMYPEVYRGRDAIRDSMVAWFKAFPDTNWELQHLMSSGDTFVAEGIFKGKHDGPLAMGDSEIPATGKSVEVPCCFVGRVSPNGLIAEDRTYLNSAIMMEQLGVA